MTKRLACLLAVLIGFPAAAAELGDAVMTDYNEHLAGLFDHFHRNPELSTIENETARRMAMELSLAGFDVTEGVGGTGVVAMLENGEGPLVMMRADMDGLPVEEKSGLENASRARQVDPITGNEVFVMHACGHDVHITSLVGTARYMAANRDQWAGTLMLVVQPAEERVLGARAMRDDGIWERFGTPDYALAFHVSAGDPLGTITVEEDDAYAGADTVDIIVHGIGAHGASPHSGKDPVLIGSQIVVALQTLPEDKLPEVIISNESVPPTVNDADLARRLKTAWVDALGDDIIHVSPPEGMGAEDFPFFTVDPDIPSVYWSIGGTPQAEIDAEENGGPPVPSHHSPLFKIEPASVTTGVESTVIALLELMPR